MDAIINILSALDNFGWIPTLLITFQIMLSPMLWKLDLNELIRDRRKNKYEKQREKAIQNCSHQWIHYPLSNLSKCNECFGWIHYHELIRCKTIKCCVVKTRHIHNGVLVEPENPIHMTSPHNAKTQYIENADNLPTNTPR